MINSLKFKALVVGVLSMLTILPVAVEAQDAGLTVFVGANQSWWRGKDLSTLGVEGVGITMGKDLPNLEAGDTKLYDDEGMDQTRVNPLTGQEEVLSEYIMALSSLQNKTGYMIGFEVNSEITSHFWLKHQFFFNTKGFAFQGTRFDTLGRTIQTGVQMRLRTLNVDIVPFGVDASFEGVQVYTGPYVSVLLNAQWVEFNRAGEAEVTQAGVYDFHYYDLATDKLEAREIGILDYGWAGGLEYEFPFGMVVGSSFKWGVGRMLEARPRHTKTAIYNSQISFYLGYMFGEE